ncbi:DUF7286 family protein [Halobacterium zhouii]|uniref:DUF7286 family protein n=1 Tax=Halobacterium zhouii TaxID=2902624 RepID=UPI001E2A3C81|nr:hypothetical protein [Halobacterium zhouii]
MNVADDERGRVPFALVGVLLLVASATTTASLAGQDPAPTRTRADRAADRVETGASVAVAGAARTALRAAARNPVVSPADSRYGAALSADSPFRDALALRIYARAERALGNVTATAGNVRASVSLTRIRSPADAERAIDRVAVEQVNDSLVRVTVEDVRVTLRRNGRVVSRSRTNVSVTVESATLELASRVSRFEALLDRGALAGPGLDRRLTDFLHRVVWLRGPMQYAGLPIANVLANRHVELMTNRALLSLQRSAFGRVDGDGSEAYRSARARVGVTDVVAATERAATDRATAALGGHRSARADSRTRDGYGGADGSARGSGDADTDAGDTDEQSNRGLGGAVSTGPLSRLGATGSGHRSVPVGVNVTADRAFVGLVDGSGRFSLDRLLRAAYTAVGRRTVTVSRVDTAVDRSGRAPENWSLAETTTDRTTRVSGQPPASSPLPGDYRRTSRHGRRVVVTEETVRRYVRDGKERTVTETRRRTYRVTVAVGFRFQQPAGVPAGSDVESVLANPVARVTQALRERISARATRQLVKRAGGVDSLARRAVAGEQVNRDVLLRLAPSDAVRERALAAASALRDRAWNVSANVSMAELASGDTPADELRNRVDGLYGAPGTHATAGGRAVAAVRVAYLEAVAERLRSRQANAALSGSGAALGAHAIEDVPRASPTKVDAGSVASVDGSPAYLTLAEVDSSLAPAVETSYHPLAARNTNWFTLPHGDAADAVLSRVFDDPPRTVGLGTAGQSLRAANRTLSVAENETLRDRRDRLRGAVAESLTAAGSAYRSVLYASNVSFTVAERRAVTRRALDRWPTLAARAKAVANGSAARAVGVAAVRVADVTGTRRDVLLARLRAAAPTVVARSSVEVEAELVGAAARSVRSVGRALAREALTEATGAAAERVVARARRSYASVTPAGLPLVPVPGYWYATFNAWSVSVRGSWARFAVRARGGSPVGPGEGTAYVREEEPVAFDVNGDGDPERVGRNERLSFEVTTTVAIVVPPGPQGVGDVDGQRTETSSGW